MNNFKENRSFPIMVNTRQNWENNTNILPDSIFVYEIDRRQLRIGDNIHDFNNSSVIGTPTPKGTIIMWNEAYNKIPEGWHICDGTNGTPNLLDKFIKCVKSNENPQYDSNDHGTHTITLTLSNLPAHNHSFTVTNSHTHNLNSHLHLLTHILFDSDKTYHQHNVFKGGALRAFGGGDTHSDILTIDDPVHPGYHNSVRDYDNQFRTCNTMAEGGSHTHYVNLSFDADGSKETYYSILNGYVVATKDNPRSFDNRPKFYEIIFIMKII